MANQTFVEALGLVKETGILDFLLPFIVVFAIVYGMLLKSKILGEKQHINAIVAFVIAMMVTLNPSMRGFISQLLPLYTVFFILLIMMIFFFVFFGVKGKNIVSKTPVWLLIFAFLLILFIVSLGAIEGEELRNIGLGSGPMGNESVGDWTTRPWGEQIILGFRDPKVFGMIIMLVMFAIATYAIIKFK